MNKIVDINKAIDISKELRQKGKTVVLAGGCFDLLHIGHIKFLEKAKAQGDKLFILLESDENIKKSKGEKRPINSQKDRAKILSLIPFVDYVVILKTTKNNKDYEHMVIALKPAIIAATQNDPNRNHKERQAKLINAKVINVVEEIKNRSTTRLIKLVSNNF